jgi:23S rRNA maturation mini-RNase III
MTKIKEIIKFNKEDFFDGAIQADWFYNLEKRDKVANSYIFHGPKYFGLKDSDIKKTDHRLIDTATFANKISEKVAYDLDSSRFILTIAGYGAGKSHLAVTIGSLFSGDNRKLQEEILYKIMSVDTEIASNIKGALLKPNLVIVLNGMRDFNLNYEVLKCTREALKLHNINDDFLREMTTAYNTAKVFVEKAFEPFQDGFRVAASKKSRYSTVLDEVLKSKIINNIDTDPQAFEIVNEVFKSVNGDYIRWDNGLTAGDILLKANEVLCVEKQIFNKIVILFDEFGRYIEYTSAHPQQAGESALQQIFEAVQNANKNIIFVGFIQSDLNAYLTRVENANIVRYVGRYESSDKYYLSSNLETILANLLCKKDNDRFESVMNSVILEGNKYYNNGLFSSLQRWFKESKSRTVWSERNFFEQVILKGAYPMHPLTTWIMSNLSTWMQQRSTLTFAEEMFEEVKDLEVIDEQKINYIYPTKLIESKLFNELLNAEEKGLQQSQHCILYNSIITKYGEKFDDFHKQVLQGILIINISKFTPYDKEDTITLLKHCTGIDDKDIRLTIEDLEDNFGIIKFDKFIKRFDLLAEGNGRNDFNRKLFINKARVFNSNPISLIDADLKRELNIDKEEETSFGYDTHISSFEWKFIKKFVFCKDVTDNFIKGLDYELNKAQELEGSRGIIVFIYVDSKTYPEVNRINELLITSRVSEKPIIFILINDIEDKIKEGLIEYKALKDFSLEEKKKYEKFILEHQRKATAKITSTYFSLAKSRVILTGDSIESSNERLSIFCSKIFKHIYHKAPSFNFDGFEKGVTPTVRRYYGTIARGIITNSITNKQGFTSLAVDVANRLKSSLSIETEHSWKVLSKTSALIEPQEGVIREIYNEVNYKLKINEIHDLKNIFTRYLNEPYGMNQYSLGLFIAYFIGLNASQINIYYGAQKIKKSDFASEVYSDKKLDYLKLMKYSVQKIQGNPEEEIKKIINNISNTIHVESCVDNIKALRVLENEELDSTTASTIELLIQKMQRGIELRNSIYSDFDKYTELFDKYIVSSFNFKVIMSFSSLFSRSFEGKIQGSEFEYSPSFKESIVKLKNNIIDEISKKLEYNIRNSYKFSYEDIKTEEKLITSISATLSNVGREDLANIVKVEFSKKKEHLIEQQKYVAIFNEFENFHRMNNILNNKNYKDLENLKEDILKWNTRIGELNVSLEKRRELNQKLVKISEKINDRRSELDACRDSIIKQVTTIESMEQINEIETKVNAFLGFLPEQELEIKLRDTLDLTKSFKIDIKQFDINSLDRMKFEEISLRLDKQYENTFLYKLISKSIASAKEEIDRLDEEWMKINISEIRNKIFELSIEECESWKRNISNIPLYLKKQTTDAVKEISLLVNEQIKRNKVEGILSIFKELDIEEKERCLKLLHSILY